MSILNPKKKQQNKFSLDLVRKQDPNSIAFIKLIYKTLSSDSKSVLKFVFPKNRFLAESTKIIALFLLFFLPILAIIPFQSSLSNNGKNKNVDNSGKAVPNPHPQPQSKDQAFLITFSSGFDFKQPVTVNYPVTANKSGGGTEYVLKTINISSVSYIYIALKASQRITFKIATGKTNMYTFQYDGSSILQDEASTHQHFTGFNIFQDSSQIVKPKFNNNTNGDIYTMYATTATNHFFKKYNAYSRPKKFKNLPSRVEIEFSIPVPSKSFPLNSQMYYVYVHGEDNALAKGSVIEIGKQNTDDFWLSTKDLPKAKPSAHNVYCITDEQVAEQKNIYTFDYKDHAAMYNLYWNLHILNGYKGKKNADIYLQLDLHYTTNFKYKMVLTNIYESATSEFYYAVSMQLAVTDKKAVWF